MRNVEFTEITECSMGFIRYAYLFIKGLTRVGWSDTLCISGVIVGKKRNDKALLYPNKQILSENFRDCMDNKRTGIKGHKGRFKIIKWENYQF